MAALEEALGSLSLNQQDELARLSGAAFSPSELGWDFGMSREEAAGRLLNEFVANPVQVAPFVGGSLIPPESPITTLPANVTDLNVPTPVQPVEETQPIWERALKRIADVFIPESEGAESERSAITDAVRGHIASRESSERLPEYVPDFGTAGGITQFMKRSFGGLPFVTEENLNQQKGVENLAKAGLISNNEADQWKTAIMQRDDFGDDPLGIKKDIQAELIGAGARLYQGFDEENREEAKAAADANIRGLQGPPETDVNALIDLMSAGVRTPEYVSSDKMISDLTAMQRSTLPSQGVDREAPPAYVDTFSEPTVEWIPPPKKTPKPTKTSKPKKAEVTPTVNIADLMREANRQRSAEMNKQLEAQRRKDLGFGWGDMWT